MEASMLMIIMLFLLSKSLFYRVSAQTNFFQQDEGSFQRKNMEIDFQTFRDDFSDESTYMTPTIWYSPTNGSATYFSNGSYYATGNALVAHLRTLETIDAESLTITANLKKVTANDNHFIILSSYSTLNNSWSWAPSPGYLTFGWNGSMKSIIGQASTASTSCSVQKDYRIYIQFDKTSVTLQDDGNCAELMLGEIISTPVYLYIGADAGSNTAEWYNIAVEGPKVEQLETEVATYTTKYKLWLLYTIIGLAGGGTLIFSIWLFRPRNMSKEAKVHTTPNHVEKDKDMEDRAHWT